MYDLKADPRYGPIQGLKDRAVALKEHCNAMSTYFVKIEWASNKFKEISTDLNETWVSNAAYACVDSIVSLTAKSGMMEDKIANHVESIKRLIAELEGQFELETTRLNKTMYDEELKRNEKNRLNTTMFD